MPELKKRAQSRRIKLTGHEAGSKQRFEFGSKYELAAGLVQVKRFDAQTVAPENQFALASIPNCEGKHAAKFFDETLAIFLVEMKDNLRVRSGAEGMAALFEFGAQFAGVIGFPVVGDPGLAIRAGHGHAPAIAQVDDGEARVHQEARCEFLNALAVRTAVFHGGGHAVRGRAQGFGWAHRRDSSNSAHEIDQPSIGCREPSKPVTLSFLNEHFYTYVNDVVRTSACGFFREKGKTQLDEGCSTRIIRVPAFRQNAPKRARISGLVLQQIPDSKNQRFAVTLSVKQV